MRTMPLRWRGSRAPYGYKPEPLEGGGWTLVQDPEAVKVLARVITALLAGATVNSIVYALNADGIPSPADHWSKYKGREVEKLTKWNAVTLTRILRSETLIGWKLSNGKPVRDSEGRPVMAAREPLITRAEFDAVRALLDERSVSNSVRRDTNALLFGIAHCESCGGRMYLNAQESSPGQRPTYRCGASPRGEVCEHPMNIRADWVDEYVSSEFMRILGGLEVTHTRTIPGYDPQPEIDATLAEYEDHMAQQGRQRSSAAKAAWQRHADAIDARLAELETRPKVEPRIEEIRTGRRYADEWRHADVTGRREMLAEAGAILTVKRGTPGGWRKLDESRVSFDIRDPFFADAAAELESIAASEVSE
jgi:hypothetical protein